MREVFASFAGFDEFLAYLGVAAMLFGFDRYAHIAPAERHEEHEQGKLAAQPAE